VSGSETEGSPRARHATCRGHWSSSSAAPDTLHLVILIATRCVSTGTKNLEINTFIDTHTHALDILSLSFYSGRRKKREIKKERVRPKIAPRRATKILERPQLRLLMETENQSSIVFSEAFCHIWPNVNLLVYGTEKVTFSDESTVFAHLRVLSQ